MRCVSHRRPWQYDRTQASSDFFRRRDAIGSKRFLLPEIRHAEATLLDDDAREHARSEQASTDDDDGSGVVMIVSAHRPARSPSRRRAQAALLESGRERLRAAESRACSWSPSPSTSHHFSRALGRGSRHAAWASRRDRPDFAGFGGVLGLALGVPDGREPTASGSALAAAFPACSPASLRASSSSFCLVFSNSSSSCVASTCSPLAMKICS